MTQFTVVATAGSAAASNSDRYDGMASSEKIGRVLGPAFN